MAQQPVDLRLATEEEPGVLLLEHFEAAIGTFALEDGLAGSGPRRDAPDAADQPVERRLVVETLLELDPRHPLQEHRQVVVLRPFRRREQHRDDRKLASTAADAMLQRGPHLLVVPGSKRAGPDDHRASGALPSASSRASCQGWPGMRFHLSRNGSIPACFSRRASSSTLGLSTLLWERKTSY